MLTMTNELILRMIQLFLIFLIFWTMGNILVNAKKHGINLKEKILDGAMDWLRDRFIRYARDWNLCNEYSTF